MTKFSLKTEKRTALGKKVKKLRRQGLLPLNLYGSDIKSIALSAPFVDFHKIYQKAKTTQVVYLNVAKDEYPSLIQNVQIDPVSRKIVHADFKKIDLKQKTEVEVPLEVIGELSIVKSGEADVLVLQDKIWVECLPTKIPEKIVVDISKLDGIGSEVKAKDLPKSADYTYQLEPETLVLQIAEAKKEEIVAPVAEEVEEKEEVKPEETSETDKKEEVKSEETKPDDKK